LATVIHFDHDVEYCFSEEQIHRNLLGRDVLGLLQRGLVNRCVKENQAAAFSVPRFTRSPST
jgi:hypothetical protein